MKTQHLEVRIACEEDDEKADVLMTKWVHATNCLVGLGRNIGMDIREKQSSVKDYIQGYVARPKLQDER